MPVAWPLPLFKMTAPLPTLNLTPPSSNSLTEAHPTEFIKSFLRQTIKTSGSLELLQLNITLMISSSPSPQLKEMLHLSTYLEKPVRLPLSLDLKLCLTWTMIPTTATCGTFWEVPVSISTISKLSEAAVELQPMLRDLLLATNTDQIEHEKKKLGWLIIYIDSMYLLFYI